MGYRKNSELLEGFKYTKEIKKVKRIDNNTLEIILNDNTKIYRLHNTDIITMINNLVIYNSGGYRTITTKERLNKFTPLSNRIYQQNNMWYIDTGADIYDFYDGIAFNKDGTLASKDKKIDKKLWNKCKKSINKFASLVDNLDDIPEPSAEDCWMCNLRNEEGEVMGEKTNDHSHLVRHIKEGYLHGSLICNALEDAGYRDEFISMMFRNDMNFFTNRKDSIKRALRRYLKNRLLNEQYYKLEGC